MLYDLKKKKKTEMGQVNDTGFFLHIQLKCIVSYRTLMSFFLTTPRPEE